MRTQKMVPPLAIVILLGAADYMIAAEGQEPSTRARRFAFSRQPSKRIPKLLDIPVAYNFAKTNEARKFMEVVTRVHGLRCVLIFCRPLRLKNGYVLCAHAYRVTMNDPEFRAEAKNAKLDLNPDDGGTLERNVKEVSIWSLG